jgi:uncharacterized phage protein (TIGR02220 family)
MKDTFYFSHDYNARADEKIKLLIRKHGIQGYGIYWSIIEDLYNNANALRMDCEGIAFDLRVDEKVVKSIIEDFDLFIIEGEDFGSMSVQRRLDERDAKSRKARDSAKKRWNKDANALPTHSERNAIKERKGKESKEVISIDFDKLIEIYNSIYGRQIRVIPAKAKKQIRERLKEGYTKTDFVTALENAKNDQYHKDNNYKYITLEFISRPDKFERYSSNHNYKVQSKIL